MFEPQTRRDFLGRLGAASVGLAASRWSPATRALATGQEATVESVKVLIADVIHDLDDIRAARADTGDPTWRESRVIEAPFPFTHVGLHWRGSGQLAIQVRTGDGRGEWSPWRAIAADGSPDDNPFHEWFTTLVGADRHHLAQYRLSSASRPPDRLTVTYLNGVDGPRLPIARVGAPPATRSRIASRSSSSGRSFATTPMRKARHGSGTGSRRAQSPSSMAPITSRRTRRPGPSFGGRSPPPPPDGIACRSAGPAAPIARVPPSTP